MRTFDQTWFCNQHGYNIAEIKPYSAYDVVANEWIIRPPHLPDWSVDKFPQGHALLEEAEGYASVIEAIDKMPEPYRTQQGKSLWKHLHGDRSRAFSDQGEGWLDSGNAVEKALNEWGLWDKLVEWKYGKQAKTAAADPPTIKRGVILDGHPYKGDIENGWDPGGWDADVAHRLVNGTATHHDVLKHLDKDHVGHFWYHPDHADLEDAKDFAEPREPIHNWMDDLYDNGKIGGDVGVVLEAHHPKGWDPEKDNPAHPLEGNSYLPNNSHLKLHKLHYTADGETWHTIPVGHHNITVHTDGPREQKMAMGARGDLPDGITYEHTHKDGIHILQAQHPDMPDKNKFAGLLSWWDKDGEIGSAEVHPQMQRRGLGTELFRRAKEITPHIHHSDYLTDDAKQWISGMDKTAVKSNVIDITAYFKTASDDDDYRMMHRPPDHESGQPLHEAEETGDPDDPIHPFRDYEHHEFKGNPNDRLNKHSILDYFGAVA